MYSKTNLESALGYIVFNIYHFSTWIKGLYIVLGSLALFSNTVCLGYIWKRLNLSNVVNLIPLLECINNVIGFSVMAVVSLLALIDSSFENQTCYVNIPVLGAIFLCSKSYEHV